MRDPGNEIAHLYEFCRRSGHERVTIVKAILQNAPFFPFLLSLPMRSFISGEWCSLFQKLPFSNKDAFYLGLFFVQLHAQVSCVDSC